MLLLLLVVLTQGGECCLFLWPSPSLGQRHSSRKARGVQEQRHQGGASKLTHQGMRVVGGVVVQGAASEKANWAFVQLCMPWTAAAGLHARRLHQEAAAPAAETFDAARVLPPCASNADCSGGEFCASGVWVCSLVVFPCGVPSSPARLACGMLACGSVQLSERSVCPWLIPCAWVAG